MGRSGWGPGREPRPRSSPRVAWARRRGSGSGLVRNSEAVGVGFEPTSDLRPNRFSRPVPSATRPPHRWPILGGDYDWSCELRTRGMRVVVDTNVFLRAAQADHPQAGVAARALELLTAGGETLCLLPQVVVEFWAVATRPARENGLGLTANETKAHIDKLRRSL